MTRLVTVARCDVSQTLRERLSLAAFALVTLLVVPIYWSAVGTLRVVVELPPPPVQAVGAIPLYVATYLFLFVAAVSYDSVARERAEGTTRFLLGASGTRRDVFFGKLRARIVVVSLGVGVVLGALAGTVIPRRGTILVVAFGLVTCWVIVYAWSWAVFAVGVSESFDTPYRALGVVAGTYVVFAQNAPTRNAVLRPSLRTVLPSSLDTFTESIDPTIALNTVTEWLIATSTTTATAPSAPRVVVSLTAVFAVAGLGLVVGYRRFRTSDLG